MAASKKGVKGTKSLAFKANEVSGTLQSKVLNARLYKVKDL